MLRQLSSHQAQASLPFGVTIRTSLRLSAVEDLINLHRIKVPCPSRNTLIRMCEDGTFDARMVRGSWEVFEDSFWSWANVGDIPLAA